MNISETSWKHVQWIKVVDGSGIADSSGVHKLESQSSVTTALWVQSVFYVTL